MVNVMWEGNITLTTDLRTDLNVYFLKRWKMFSENLLGFLVYFFIEFLQLTPEVVEFLLQNGKNDVSKDFIWVKSILSAKRFAQFEKERKDFNQAIILETELNYNDFPVRQSLADLLLKIPIGEAAVKRAFSRYKYAYNRLRANLKTETLDAELFIRYNFAPILDIAAATENTINLECEN